MRECAGKVAIVTGASRGIGRAVARRLAADGASVLVTARTARAGTGELAGSLEETVDLIERAGGRTSAYATDLGDPSFDGTAVVEAAAAAFGPPVDILVNSAAGPDHLGVAFEATTREQFLATVMPSVWGAWELAAKAARAMATNGGGWILNIGSVAAEPRLGPPFPPNPLGGMVLYGAAKAMLDRVTTGAAMELYDRRIAVNSLAPQRAVRSERVQRVMTLRPEWCEPEEVVAEAALALCSGARETLTGRVVCSVGLLAELRRPVRTLDGAALVDGWQPEDLARHASRGYVELVRQVRSDAERTS